MCLLNVALSMKFVIFKSCPNLTTSTCPLPLHSDRAARQTQTVPNSTKVLGNFFLFCWYASCWVLIHCETFERMFLVMYLAFFGPVLPFGCTFFKFHYIIMKSFQEILTTRIQFQEIFKNNLFLFLSVAPFLHRCFTAVQNRGDTTNLKSMVVQWNSYWQKSKGFLAWYPHIC